MRLKCGSKILYVVDKMQKQVSINFAHCVMTPTVIIIALVILNNIVFHICFNVASKRKYCQT